jgi:Domain of unknown function (DUF4253)
MTLPRLVWLDREFERSHRLVEAGYRKFARAKARASLETCRWVLPHDEGEVRVVVHEGHVAWGPLPVGWNFTVEYGAAIGALREGWAEQLGFRPVLVGQRSIDAHVSRLPATVEHTKAMVEQFLIVCPDLAQDDGSPVSSALSVMLGEPWSFWWD